jgi:hypothetical protein
MTDESKGDIFPTIYTSGVYDIDKSNEYGCWVNSIFSEEQLTVLTLIGLSEVPELELATSSTHSPLSLSSSYNSFSSEQPTKRKRIESSKDSFVCKYPKYVKLFIRTFGYSKDSSENNINLFIDEKEYMKKMCCWECRRCLSLMLRSVKTMIGLRGTCSNCGKSVLD